MHTFHSLPHACSVACFAFFFPQPVGVGFSWSGNSEDYSMGDWDAARDNFAAIQVFLERFPAVAANDFYITAESYGGHYMPTLAKYIVDHQPNSINFKGFAVGNPFTSKVRVLRLIRVSFNNADIGHRDKKGLLRLRYAAIIVLSKKTHFCAYSFLAIF